jgi:hypothetical protein
LLENGEYTTRKKRSKKQDNFYLLKWQLHRRTQETGSPGGGAPSLEAERNSTKKENDIRKEKVDKQNRCSKKETYIF